MEIKLSSDLLNKIPELKLGVIHYKNITVGDSPQMLKGRLQLFQESIYFELEEKSVTELPGVKAWRELFKKVGKDPNRYRPSVEALFRRVKKQNYLSSVQSAIDINNFFSLKYQVPIGIYDAKKIKGPVTIHLGNKDDEYLGLNGRSNSLDNLIVSSDELGAFGSPFVDSERTSVTYDTMIALQIMYLNPSTDDNNASKLTESLANMFTQIHGGEFSFYIIGSERQTCSF